MCSTQSQCIQTKCERIWGKGDYEIDVDSKTRHSYKELNWMLDVLTSNEKTANGKELEVGDNRWTHPNWQNGATCYSTD